MRRRRSITGSVVLITGAAHGIGAATARELVRRGARVSLLDRDEIALAALAAELGSAAVWCRADVTDHRSLEAAVGRTVDVHGGIDVVVANAGVVSHGTVLVSDSDTFARTIEVNLIGVHRTVSAALPELLRSRGHALLIASLATFVPLPGAGGYSPSKAGVESLAGMLQVELAHAGVTVGTAHPCWIDTDMVRTAEAAMPTFRELRNDLPWPARSTTSPEICAAALADGIERRARKVYIPRSVALIAALRSLLNSSLGGRMAVRMAAGRMPQLDREVMAASGVEHVRPHVQPQVGSAP